MGVTGLLPFVSNACRDSNVEEFKNQRVALDVSCFLHRGVFGCVEKIAHGIETDFCIQYVEKFVNLFLKQECKVTLVFDGFSLPAKQDVNDSRKARRDSNIQRSEELLNSGRNKEAYKIMRQGIGVPKNITRGAIDYFTKSKNVEVIVAPYEADAQMAYLIQNDYVDVVVTQDSDLIVFGCKKIAFKLDQMGRCTVFDNEKLPLCFIPPIQKKFTFSMFRHVCILTGCDYLPGGLNGVGLKKAESFFAKTAITDPKLFLPKIPYYINMGNTLITKDFIENFIRADNTFLHQIVYDPKRRIQIPINPYPGTVADDFIEMNDQLKKRAEEYWYAGTFVDAEETLSRAQGSSHPSSQSDENSAEFSPKVNLKPKSVPSVTPTSSTRPVVDTIQRRPLSTFNQPVPTKRKVLPGYALSGLIKKRVVMDDSDPVLLNVVKSADKTVQNAKLEGIHQTLLTVKPGVNAPKTLSFTKVNVNIDESRHRVIMRKRPAPAASLFNHSADQIIQNQHSTESLNSTIT